MQCAQRAGQAIQTTRNGVQTSGFLTFLQALAEARNMSKPDLAYRALWVDRASCCWVLWVDAVGHGVGHEVWRTGRVGGCIPHMGYRSWSHVPL
jgi:hypothetical protein